MADKVAASQENNEDVTEDGIEDAFEVGLWILMSTDFELKVNFYFKSALFQSLSLIYTSQYHNLKFFVLFWMMKESLHLSFLCVICVCPGPGWDPGDCQNRTLGRRLFHLYQLCEQTQLLCRRRDCHYCSPWQVKSLVFFKALSYCHSNTIAFSG